MRTVTMACAICAFAGLTACSTQTAYYSTQSWQRQQCFKIDDAQQRQRCLKSASTSYEDYQRETETVQPKP